MQTNMQIMKREKVMQMNMQTLQTNMQTMQYASQASASSFDMIAEYVPGSDVTQHSRLDLDQVTS